MGPLVGVSSNIGAQRHQRCSKSDQLKETTTGTGGKQIVVMAEGGLFENASDQSWVGCLLGINSCFKQSCSLMIWERFFDITAGGKNEEETVQKKLAYHGEQLALIKYKLQKGCFH